MDCSREKCVMVLDEALPHGVAANAAGILGITLGRHRPDTVGPDVRDRWGRAHLGIIALPVPVLKADRDTIKALRSRLFEAEYAGLITVDFSDVARSCHTYGAYVEQTAAAEELYYAGIAICGDRRLVNKLTGSLPLLR